jgi:hypothetical protein
MRKEFSPQDWRSLQIPLPSSQFKLSSTQKNEIQRQIQIQMKIPSEYIDEYDKQAIQKKKPTVMDPTAKTSKKPQIVGLIIINIKANGIFIQSIF